MNALFSFMNPAYNPAAVATPPPKPQNIESPKPAPSLASIPQSPAALNESPNSHLDFKITRLAMLAIPTVLGIYALNATSNSKNNISGIFHGVVGYCACTSAYGLAKAQYEMTSNPNNGEFLNKSVEYTITAIKSPVSMVQDFIDRNRWK